VKKEKGISADEEENRKGTGIFVGAEEEATSWERKGMSAQSKIVRKKGWCSGGRKSSGPE